MLMLVVVWYQRSIQLNGIHDNQLHGVIDTLGLISNNTDISINELPNQHQYEQDLMVDNTVDELTKSTF